MQWYGSWSSSHLHMPSGSQLSFGSLTPSHGWTYSLQTFVKKFVSNLWLDSGQVVLSSLPIKTEGHETKKKRFEKYVLRCHDLFHWEIPVFHCHLYIYGMYTLVRPMYLISLSMNGNSEMLAQLPTFTHHKKNLGVYLSLTLYIWLYVIPFIWFTKYCEIWFRNKKVMTV